MAWGGGVEQLQPDALLLFVLGLIIQPLIAHAWLIIGA
jgi:hypothetical protein